MRNTYPVRGAQKSAHRHGVHLQRVGETNDPKILNADFLNGRFVGIDTHNEFGQQNSASAEKTTASAIMQRSVMP